MNYVFDVDGTLTPSRGKIDPYFAEWFLDWMKTHPVYLCSGSDYAKTLEQLGEEICASAKSVYSCCGNAKYIGGQLVRSTNFKLTAEELAFLEDLLEASPFPIRTGQHIEHRLGLYNFSVVGRGADKDERKLYFDYDSVQGERPIIAEKINRRFPYLEATVAGETGIDIYLRGKDKSQIADEVAPYTYFGDTIYFGGNDFSVALKAERYYNVKSWEETWLVLKSI